MNRLGRPGVAQYNGIATKSRNQNVQGGVGKQRLIERTAIDPDMLEGPQKMSEEHACAKKSHKGKKDSRRSNKVLSEKEREKEKTSPDENANKKAGKKKRKSRKTPKDGDAPPKEDQDNKMDVEVDYKPQTASAKRLLEKCSGVKQERLSFVFARLKTKSATALSVSEAKEVLRAFLNLTNYWYLGIMQCPHTGTMDFLLRDEKECPPLLCQGGAVWVDIWTPVEFRTRISQATEVIEEAKYRATRKEWKKSVKITHAALYAGDYVSVAEWHTREEGIGPGGKEEKSENE